MPYYSGPKFFNDVKFNVETLKKPVLPLIDPTEDLVFFFREYTPKSVKQNILAAAANGCVGLGFWPTDNFDGSYLAEIAEGFDRVAKAERYYFGEKCDAAVSVLPPASRERTFSDGGKTIKATSATFGDEVQFTAHLKDGNYLLTLFNYNDTTDAVVSVK
jgi:hypothetical protein